MKDMKRTLALFSVIFMLCLSSVAFAQEMRNGYDLIVKNNLFRPLGWAPQPHVPSYELLITKLHPDGNRAMIRMDGRTYYVKEGDKIGEVVVNKIEERKVEIQDGDQTRELRIEISGVVGGSGGRGGRGGPRGRGGEASFAPKQSGAQSSQIKTARQYIPIPPVLITTSSPTLICE